MRYKVGDEVIVFQDTKSMIGDNLGKYIIISLHDNSKGSTDRYVLKSSNSLYTFYIHPDDFRKITKLEKVME